MSRQRSQSPHYRMFPWDEPDFDPHKVIAELHGMPQGRRHGSGEDPEEHWDYLRGDMSPDGRRRSPPFRGDHHFPHERHPEEFYRRRLSPFQDVIDYGDQRFSPQHNIGVEGDRCGERFRQHFEDFEDRRRSQSPVRLQRERLPLSPRSQSDQLQRHHGMEWRREDQGRSRGKFSDHSPGGRSDDQRGGVGRERGQRNAQSPNKNRRREAPRMEQRNPPFKRHRREMDDASHLGYGKEEEFGEQRYSVETPRDGFAGDAQGKILHSGPLVVEHDHGIDNRDALRQEHFSSRRDHDFNLNRQRSPYQVDSRMQEHFRKPNSRLDEWEDTSGDHFQDTWKDPNYHEARRSPLQQDRPNPMRYAKQNSPMNHGGRSDAFPAKGRFNRGRNGPPRGPQLFHQSSQEYQKPLPEQQRPAYQPLREDRYKEMSEEEPNWEERGRFQPWGGDRPASADRHLPREDLDPKMPRSRERGWNNPKANSMTVVSEETLTIKVDMSRPVNQNSQLCYSSDRQLSLDLVNVGRQRLDFLPMLEHSGTYRETAMHTGTFAQEIITLVHQVKDQYFRGDDITLNERFSAPQKGSYSEEEMEELTLDQRFSSTRGFSLNVNSFDDDEPLFSRLGPMQGLGMQPARDPGDLRHDLERRRQERLEGVKVTIPGTSLPQRPLGPVSEQTEYGDKDGMFPMDDVGFPNWPTQQNRRREGNVRRGAPYKKSVGPQRKNNRLGNRLGPFRKQNHGNNPTGPNW
ncbi:BCLAF1 and THRAP3 family member 3 isoform X2 [Sphaeramia orbicularis]|uniref:BCLAF1 and THRAP3 family member 3 isoform X2 n=1 Tax=Sphaeramia orbicularis TaxID=375764 RepID=UPI00117EAD17|nr:BCLAF1 and THRAP3 family member 3-like isoform X2 [Sphaeramia orbicularis]